MSDGREERQADKLRIERQKQDNSEDRIDYDDPDRSQPERVDS